MPCTGNSFKLIFRSKIINPCNLTKILPRSYMYLTKILPRNMFHNLTKKQDLTKVYLAKIFPKNLGKIFLLGVHVSRYTCGLHVYITHYVNWSVAIHNTVTILYVYWRLTITSTCDIDRQYFLSHVFTNHTLSTCYDIDTMVQIGKYMYMLIQCHSYCDQLNDRLY